MAPRQKRQYLVWPEGQGLDRAWRFLDAFQTPELIGILMNAFFAYTLLLVGMPVFVGMFIGSFVMRPVSRILYRFPSIERTHLRFPEVLNGLAAAAAGALYFRVCGLTPSLIVPIIIAAWVSLYCIVSHQHLPNWLSWLGGLVIGWFALGRMVLAA